MGHLALMAGCAQKKTAPETPDKIQQFEGVHRRSSFHSKDGLELFAQYWAPTHEPKAMVLLLHGTTMHSGAYSQAAKFLADRGYLVYGLDLRSWGRSEGRGSKGYVSSFDKYITDVKFVSKHLKDKFPNQNLYVLGESLGATVSMYGYLKDGLPFDGMIFSGPGYKPNPQFLGIRSPQLASDLSMAAGEGLGELMPIWPTLPSNLGIARVIDDPEMQERLLKDPHVSHNWLPAKYLSTLSKANYYLRSHVNQLDLPILIVHGEHDVLIPVSSSKELLDRAETNDTTLKTYPVNHATLLESKRFQVYQEIANWLDKHENDDQDTPLSSSNANSHSDESSMSPTLDSIVLDIEREAKFLTGTQAYEKGSQEFHRGNYGRARQYLLIAQDKLPGHVKSLLYLGLAELRLETVSQDQAIKRFETALAIDPDNKVANNLLSNFNGKKTFPQ